MMKYSSKFLHFSRIIRYRNRCAAQLSWLRYHDDRKTAALNIIVMYFVVISWKINKDEKKKKMNAFRALSRQKLLFLCMFYICSLFLLFRPFTQNSLFLRPHRMHFNPRTQLFQLSSDQLQSNLHQSECFCSKTTVETNNNFSTNYEKSAWKQLITWKIHAQFQIGRNFFFFFLLLNQIRLIKILFEVLFSYFIFDQINFIKFMFRYNCAAAFKKPNPVYNSINIMCEPVANTTIIRNKAVWRVSFFSLSVETNHMRKRINEKRKKKKKKMKRKKTKILSKRKGTNRTLSWSVHTKMSIRQYMNIIWNTKMKWAKTSVLKQQNQETALQKQTKDEKCTLHTGTHTYAGTQNDEPKPNQTKPKKKKKKNRLFFNILKCFRMIVIRNSQFAIRKMLLLVMSLCYEKENDIV